MPVRPDRWTLWCGSVFRGCLLVFIFVFIAGCARAIGGPRMESLPGLRRASVDAADPEVLGLWMLSELVSPTGNKEAVAKARTRLERTKPDGMYSWLALALDDEIHGLQRRAADEYMEALRQASRSADEEAPLIAWFSSSHLLALRASVPRLWDRARPIVEHLLANPGSIGWRARGELVEWWSLDAFRALNGDKSTVSPVEEAAKLYGCVSEARMAGPFGSLAPSDTSRHFAAELARPWPLIFDKEPERLETPRVVPTERRGCELRAKESSSPGIYYVETFLDLSAEREAILAVQGALSILVDDYEVLTRGPSEWGVWPRFGVRLRLSAGRHRVVARLATRETSIRVLSSQGTPLEVRASTDSGAQYSLEAPLVLPQSNVLEPFLQYVGVPPLPGHPVEKRIAPFDALALYLAADLAHLEGQDELAAVLLSPITDDNENASGAALSLHAVIVDRDTLFPETMRRDLAKRFASEAAGRDPRLFWPRLFLLVDETQKDSVIAGAKKLEALLSEFPEVPQIEKSLAAIYGRAGFKAEHSLTLKKAAARFPDDRELVRNMIRLYEDEGNTKEADLAKERLKKLDPESEIEFELALMRKDYEGAIRELHRMAGVRADRRELALRTAELLTRAGSPSETMRALELSVERDPRNAAARLALADAQFGAGDTTALERALVESIRTGADTASLREAMELLTGVTELTPFRKDGLAIVKEYEQAKPNLPGTASRVLDYSALRIHADGSAAMLEHEILFMQSREAIQDHAEQEIPRGMLLKLRTIKANGRTYEPEFIEGKPTVTMPHLEVGDYIEMESVTSLPGDGQGGLHFEGPRWYFREEKVSYYRSEFVIISPESKPLDIEIGGDVPEPELTHKGGLIFRRYRVHENPAVPEEPRSAPLAEFLPNVRIGWGIDLAGYARRMTDLSYPVTPLDPRLRKLAQEIGEKGGGGTSDEKARRLYRWVLSNIEIGKEEDPRQVITGRTGNRMAAFAYLCRLAGIKTAYGIVRDRLAPPSRGPLSEVEAFGRALLRIETDKGTRWLEVRDKYAPYGYLPSALRGQPAILLIPGNPREVIPTEGASDGVSYTGTVELRADGSAGLSLIQKYEGKFALALRTALERVPASRLSEMVETRLIPQTLPGAKLTSASVANFDSFDEPLVLNLKLEVSGLARVMGDELILSPPFAMQFSGLAGLPSRQTPLYLSEQAATHSTVSLRMSLPSGATLITPIRGGTASFERFQVTAKDRIDKGDIVLERMVDVPASRVTPAAYPDFQAFTRRADSILNAELVIRLKR